MSDDALAFEEAGRRVAAAIAASVGRAVGGVAVAAVAFSGGLDSSILAHCASKRTRVLACSAYVDGAADSRNARRAASVLGLTLHEDSLTREQLLSELGSAPNDRWRTPMDRSLWCLFSVVARSAAAAGARVMLLGQLADELFGGYAKYREPWRPSDAITVEALMEGDVGRYLREGMARDVDACTGKGVIPLFPFADEDVVGTALSVPLSLRMRGGVGKAVLREAALVLGLPPELAAVPKKAAQYSSGFQKVALRSTLLTPRPEGPS